MRVLNSVILFLGAVTLVSAAPGMNGHHDGNNKMNHSSDGSMDHHRPVGHMGQNHSASWDGSGHGGKKKHQCKPPRHNSSFDGSHDGSQDGWRHGSHRGMANDCGGSNSSSDDIDAVSSPVPSASSSADGGVKQVATVAASLALVTVYLVV